MATVLLSAAGAALGGSIGGSVAGLSSAVIGRAVGATLGRVIDQRLLGQGSEPVESGKVERFRLTQASDGAPIGQVFGRMRVGGQVIWASDFQESSVTVGGGKGGPPSPSTTQYSYSVSLAVAVCEGEIAGVNRVWADGEEIAKDDLNLRVYTGSSDQLPDPVMEAVEGAGNVPAYRGTAYVVMEDLSLEPFGNRVPQFSFEVVRAEQPEGSDFANDPQNAVRGVALMPGTGEYTLATSTVYYTDAFGGKWAANVNSPAAKPDFLASMEALEDELPSCEATSLVVSWFGGDLRCGSCELRPKFERAEFEGANMPWVVAGETRASGVEIEQNDGRPIYGGTPADAAVVEAIRYMNENGLRVMFYPFILMDQQAGNGLGDPWSSAADQPHLPWRGRITLSVAPGREGSPDGTADADAQVAAFFGTARATDFVIGDGVVTYSGPEDWGMRRFILHYAALCAAAGGVDSFCIGSEMRSLTQIRGVSGFPAVETLREIAADVRALLGPDVKIGYAADWSEYFGYQPQDGTGDRYFHLDPLWADANIDFIGIDNYMPLSDWRDGDDHLDQAAGWQSIYDLDYLRDNVEGGEGYDWFYHSPEARAAQIRTPIEDAEHNEPWVWRYKDMRNWWLNSHHERIDGARSDTPTDWVPQSKPIWFTEYGCAAIDKGTNQPNKFLDPKSSESSLPRFSNGARDDLMQAQYLKAVTSYWAADNPVSEVYGAPMLDMNNAFVWAWDVRPFPTFPNNLDLWSDGENHARGHWLNGRIGARTLASVVEEVCRRAGVEAIDTSDLFGVVRGFVVDNVSDARQALQPLMLFHGFDAVERDGVLQFRMRDKATPVEIATERFAERDDTDGLTEFSRAPEAEMSGRVRVRFVQAGGDHDIAAEEAVLPDDATHAVATTDLPLALTRAEGRQVAERWLSETRVARDSVRFALPPSKLALGAGDVVRMPDGDDQVGGLFRIDRVDQGAMQMIDAVRMEPSVFEPGQIDEDLPSLRGFVPPVPVLPVFLDLPLLTGDEVEHAPHLAITAQPWPGAAAVYASASDDNYALEATVTARATVGRTETPLSAAPLGIWDEGPVLQVRLMSGALESRDGEAVLNGANLAAIGDGSSGGWELIQFQQAELIAPDTYWISTRLRGQAGSDGLMPSIWPTGSWFVLIDGAVGQIPLTSAQRQIARHYRIGPARRPVDDPSYTYLVEAVDGNGLRPYAPAFLQIEADGSGDLSASWIRRTRIDGDNWELADVPLGEAVEAYRVRVVRGTTVLREETVTAPAWTYLLADQIADGAMPGDVVDVAQISDRFGPGLAAQVALPVV